MSWIDKINPNQATLIRFLSVISEDPWSQIKSKNTKCFLDE